MGLLALWEIESTGLLFEPALSDSRTTFPTTLCSVWRCHYSNVMFTLCLKRKFHIVSNYQKENTAFKMCIKNANFAVFDSLFLFTDGWNVLGMFFLPRVVMTTYIRDL